MDCQVGVEKFKISKVVDRALPVKQVCPAVWVDFSVGETAECHNSLLYSSIRSGDKILKSVMIPRPS